MSSISAGEYIPPEEHKTLCDTAEAIYLGVISGYDYPGNVAAYDVGTGHESTATIHQPDGYTSLRPFGNGWDIEYGRDVESIGPRIIRAASRLIIVAPGLQTVGVRERVRQVFERPQSNLLTTIGLVNTRRTLEAPRQVRLSEVREAQTCLDGLAALRTSKGTTLMDAIECWLADQS